MLSTTTKRTFDVVMGDEETERRRNKKEENTIELWADQYMLMV